MNMPSRFSARIQASAAPAALSAFMLLPGGGLAQTQPPRNVVEYMQQAVAGSGGCASAIPETPLAAALTHAPVNGPQQASMVCGGNQLPLAALVGDIEDTRRKGDMVPPTFDLYFQTSQKGKPPAFHKVTVPVEPLLRLHKALEVEAKGKQVLLFGGADKSLPALAVKGEVVLVRADAAALISPQAVKQAMGRTGGQASLAK